MNCVCTELALSCTAPAGFEQLTHLMLLRAACTVQLTDRCVHGHTNEALASGGLEGLPTTVTCN